MTSCPNPANQIDNPATKENVHIMPVRMEIKRNEYELFDRCNR
jgi:hypothetical protein